MARGKAPLCSFRCAREVANSGNSLRIFRSAGRINLRVVRRQNPLPTREWEAMKRERGMSPWVNAVGWAGGYPFEVAKPEAIFDFCRQRGFVLENLKTCGGGHGCNEYVFRRQGLP